ncbi:MULTISPECIES: hypothetical protein, partial [unclassified Bradyrhizobium]|uniref:hypothetical protein n=1 Tax=unclassified Bradyrhizobium TaxID=2631580 RepID=UPI001AED8F79
MHLSLMTPEITRYNRFIPVYPRNRLHDQHPQPPASFQSRQRNRPNWRGRIASPRMLLDNFSPMIGSVPSNWFGGVYGGKDQYGRAARGGV